MQSVPANAAAPEPMVDVNTTPLIDVMLVLLVMLIITIPIQSQEVKLDLPNPNNPPPRVIPAVVNVGVDFDGMLSWDGTPLTGRAALDRDLAAAAAEHPQPELHLSANHLARYRSVAAVLADAQRLGLLKIGIVGGGPYGA